MKRYLLILIFLIFPLFSFAKVYKTSDDISLEHDYFYRLLDRASAIAPSKYFTDNFKPYSSRETIVVLNSDDYMRELFGLNKELESISKKASRYYTFKDKKRFSMNLFQEIGLNLKYKSEKDVKFYEAFGPEYENTNYHLQLDFKGGVRIRDFLLISYTIEGAYDEENEFELNFYKFNFKKGFKHISIALRKDYLVLGPGYFGNLLMSANVRPELTLIAKTEIPYDLGFIGAFRWYMWHIWYDDDERVNKDPKLWGMRFSLKPTDWFEIAGNRVIYYGGEGNPTYNSISDYWKLFTAKDENTGNKWDTEQIAGIDMSVYLPFLKRTKLLKGGKIYTEYSWTDITAPWQTEDKGKSLQLTGTSYIYGVFVTTGFTDFRFEYTKISKIMYKNHNFGLDGYTDEEYLIGHFAGRDSKSFYAEIYHEISNRLHFYFGGGYIKRGLNLPIQQKVKYGYVGGKYFCKRNISIDLSYKKVYEDKTDINDSPIFYTFIDKKRDYDFFFLKISFLN